MVQKSWKITEIWNGAKEKNVDLVKSFPTSMYLQKFGFDTTENEPPKGSKKYQKMYTLNDPVGDP